MPSKRITFDIPEYADLHRIAKRLNLSTEQVIKQAVKYFRGLHYENVYQRTRKKAKTVSVSANQKA